MEEILASIRKIIADDQVLPLTPRAARNNYGDEAAQPIDESPRYEQQAEPERRRPAPPQARPPVDFHSGLASIFSSERPPAPRPPRPEATAAEPVARYEVPAGPQLVVAMSAPEPAPARMSPPPVQAEVDFREQAPVPRPRAEADVVREMRAATLQSSQRVHRIEPPAPQLPVLPDEMRTTPRPLPVAQPTAPERVAQRAVEEALSEHLLSEQSDASIASAFRDLTASVALPDSDMIEAATRELLRPMLKEWLDDNLPVMVERLVRAEIERVARGGR
jgi:cell pole-organizing protein PopZ